MRNICLLAVLFSLSGCLLFEPPKPMYDRMFGNQLASDHNPSARQGWEDGCETGYAVYGNHFYKAFYDYKRDPNMVGDKQYEMNWYQAYHYCRQSINTVINAGVW